jgi:hypothetical protein
VKIGPIQTCLRYAATPPVTAERAVEDPAERALLERCCRFRSLDDHSAAVGRALAADPDAISSIRAVLDRLAGEGHLISEPEAARRAADVATRDAPAAPIGVVGIPTRNRPRMVVRCAVAYADHAARHGRRIRTVVMDDGTDGAARHALTEVAGRLEGPVDYAGLEEKRAYARKLAEVAGAPEEVVAFALLDPFDTGSTYGANRNALILETIGEMLLSADDDTLPKPYRPPGAEPGIAVAGGRPPIDYWFFDDLEAGMEHVAASDEDVFATLESMLGRPASALIAEAGDRVNLERVGQDRLARLLDDPGRVVAVMPGMLGDVGGESPLYHLLSARGESHRAMVATEESYRMALGRRDQLRAVRTPALSQGGYLMTTAAAFDVREMVPPFFPVFRCEDNLYGDLLRWCRPHDWIGHVPTALVHSPEGARTYDNAALEKPGFLLPLAGILSLLLEDAAGEGGGCGHRLHRMGRTLAATVRAGDFEEVIRARVASSVRERIRYVRLCREAYADSPEWWHQDLERHARALESIPEAAEVIPWETGSLEDVRELLAAFAELLGWWPTMWRAAMELRSAGETLAVPLRSR